MKEGYRKGGKLFERRPQWEENEKKERRGMRSIIAVTVEEGVEKENDIGKRVGRGDIAN